MSSASPEIIHILWTLEVCYRSHDNMASHKSNPSTQRWVTWEAVTGVEGIHCWGVATTHAG
jgi:hypothetical protein